MMVKKYLTHPLLYAVCILSVTFLFIFTGCSSQSKNSFSSSRLGIRFDFPEGWTRLSPSEMKKRFPGKSTIITIEDPQRKALMSLSEGSLPPEAQRSANVLGKNLTARLAVLLGSFEEAFSRRYEEYKLLKKGLTKFANCPGLGEIILIGRRPGEEKLWRRLIILVHPHKEDKIWFLTFSVPVEEKESYAHKFQFIEDSWKWE